MKKIIAILIVLILVFTCAYVTSETPATPTDLTPIVDPPSNNTITVTKHLKGEIWQVRCDVMDNTLFIAGGGFWYADMCNWEKIPA